MIDIEANENRILEVRKHWWVLFKELLVILFVTVIPFAIYGGLASADVVENIPGEEPFLFFAILAGWLLCMWIAAFMVWTEYYLDLWLITDQKLISVDQKGIFSREISTVQLNKVQDVTVEVHGFMATFLRYGNVKIQTAGEEREFIIYNVADPSRIEMVINRAIEEYDREH